MIKVQLSKVEAVRDLMDMDIAEMEALDKDLLVGVMRKPADFTGRVLPAADDRVEFAAQLRFEVVCPSERPGEDIHDGYGVARAVFFQDATVVNYTEDLSDLVWTPDHYEIIY